MTFSALVAAITRQIHARLRGFSPESLPINHGRPKLPVDTMSSVVAVSCFFTSSLVLYIVNEPEKLRLA